MNEEPWYSARCIFRHTAYSPERGREVYEERIVLFRAESADDAIRRAEEDAMRYEQETNGVEYLGYCMTYHLFECSVGDGSEVFSLIRESDLDSGEYISRFFDTGTERAT
jgi:hypothetical protein